MLVSRLGYAAVKVTDVDKALRFYVDTLGFQETGREGETIYLSCGLTHHDLIIKRAASPGLDRYCWKVASEEALGQLEKRLQEHGVATEWGTDMPRQGRTLRFTDPFGHVVEAVHSIEPAGSGLSVKGVEPLAVHHLALFVDDVQKGIDFYTQCLGFTVSDYVRMGPDLIGAFLRCNVDHHVIAMLKGPVGKLHHVNFLVQTFDDLRRGANRLFDGGYTIEYGPGKHGIGYNTFLYFFDDDGNRLELSSEMALVHDEDDYPTKTWDENTFKVGTNMWGGPPPESFFGQGT